jgi:dephospho-CoA kinase
MALKVGITGGIGSGKTTVCKLFQLLDIPVYDSDANAKRLMIEDHELKSAIIDLFGKNAYFTESGALNRKFISDLVFSRPILLDKLNSIVHPAVQADYQKWHENFQGKPYTLKEAALIYETGGQKWLDKVIMVFAPEEIRIRRVVDRENVKPDDVNARMKRQMPDYEKMMLADFIIFNDGNHFLIPQVTQIHHKMLKIAELR